MTTVMMQDARHKICDALKQMKSQKAIDKSPVFECLNNIHQAQLTQRKCLVEPTFSPKKGDTSIILFVGLQGSGKTTACIKYAHHHMMKGFRPALVGADKFTTAAFDEWKNNAIDASIPFHGSNLEESDPVETAVEGVERFKKEDCDVIIVDTSGRHKLKEDLLEEIRKVYEETKPDFVICAVDSSVGKDAFDEVEAFRKSIVVGAIFLTKVDAHDNRADALTAAARYKCPVTFIGSGKCVDEFEVFDTKSYVSRLIGGNDWGLGPTNNIMKGGMGSLQSELQDMLLKGPFTLRTMYEICQKLLNWSKYQEVLQQTLLPEFCAELLPNNKETEIMVLQQTLLPELCDELNPSDYETDSMVRLKRFVSMMEFLTDQELDSFNRKLIKNPRIKQIAIGCGCEVSEVVELLEVFNRLAKVWIRTKAFTGLTKKSEHGRVDKIKGVRCYTNPTVSIRI